MAATRAFGAQTSALASAEHAFLITPDDANDLAFVTRALRIATAGAVKVTLTGGETIVYPSGALAPGVAHAICATRVWQASTTATGIVGEY